MSIFVTITSFKDCSLLVDEENWETDVAISTRASARNSGYNCPRIKHVIRIKDLLYFLHNFYCFLA